MLVGFVFWYRGLALGGIAGVGQLQLLQPFFGLLLAGLVLGEPVAWTMIAVTALVVAVLRALSGLRVLEGNSGVQREVITHGPVGTTT